MAFGVIGPVGAIGVKLGATEVGGATGGAPPVVGVAAFGGGGTAVVAAGGATQFGAVGVFAHFLTAASYAFFCSLLVASICFL